MSSSPYSYSRPGLPIQSDVWVPVTPAGGPPAATREGDRATPASTQRDTPAAPPREPLNAWGAELARNPPNGVKLSFTAAHYPHVVNQLAVFWNDWRALLRYVDSLLMDDRVQRKGFDFEALDELTGIKNVRVRQLRALERGRY